MMVGFQCQSFFFLFHYEMSKTVGFVSLRDLNDGRFWWVTTFQRWSVLVGYKISKMVGFQCQSVFYRDEISKTVSFVSLRVFNDRRFCSVASRFC